MHPSLPFEEPSNHLTGGQMMRFVTDFDDRNGHWLVVDASNNNEIVGDHESATLAALDAIKREEDSRLGPTGPHTVHKPAA